MYGPSTDPEERAAAETGAAAVGAELRELFTKLVETLRPGYGTIQTIGPLFPPRKLAVTPGAWRDFGDFFLGRDYLGARRWIG